MDQTTLIIIGVVVAVLVLLSVGFLISRWRKGQKAKAEEYHHFRCFGCGRKLRYRARQAGNKGQCSHCGHGLVFPPIGR